MGSPFGAATLQLGIGAGTLLVLAVLAGMAGAFGNLDAIQPWMLIGGLGSAVYITVGVVALPRLGALVLVGLLITGQMLASVVLDAAGWLGVAQRSPGPAMALGAIAVVVGAAAIVAAQAEAAGTDAALRHPGSIALALLGGAVLPVQGAINAQLESRLDATLAVGAISFIVATAAMAIALTLTIALGAQHARVGALPTVPWWGWAGGLCGATYVTAVFSLIPEIGTAAVVVLTVAGQQVVSIALDRYGLLRLPRRPIVRRRLLGVALVLAGVALISAG